MDKATANKVNEVKDTIARFTQLKEQTKSLIAQQPGLAQLLEDDLKRYESLLTRCKSYIAAVTN